MYCRPYKKTFIIIKKYDIIDYVKMNHMSYEDAYEKAIKDKMEKMKLDSNVFKISHVTETSTTFHVYLTINI